MTAARERTAAEQLVLDQAAMWIDRHASAQTLLTLGDPTWRQAAISVVDGWAVLYLLLLLRQHDPDTADRAASFLQNELGQRNLPQLIADWQYAIATGQEPQIPI